MSVEFPQAADYDVVVIGGGPAGSTVATLVAREGRRVLLLDRERFPRFRIGESLMPATYWTLQRLGVLDRMRKSGFPEKRSVQFFAQSGRSSLPFYFSEFDDHESSQTWQVDRAEFDQLLLDNTRAAGSEVCQRANVRDVLFDGSRATGVLVEFGDGSRREIRSKVVVDATGQTALIARRLKLKQKDPKLMHAAFFTRYRGAVRDEDIDEGATLIMQTKDNRSWFWYVPLPDDLVSVGVVGPVGYLMRGRPSEPQAVYDEEVLRCPALQERLRPAQRIWDVAVMRDFSYISSRIAGDGWVMAGDAFGFLDPIYSTGVFLAFKSAELAADATNEAFSRNDFSAAQLGKYGDHYVEGMESMRKLVYAYYDTSFHVPQFLKRHPECREHIVNLLIGNVFRVSLDGLFDSMSEFTELPEARRLDPVGEST